MKKRLVAVTAVVLTSLTLSGCFPTGEKDPNVSNGFSDGKYFEYSKDNLTAAFEIPEISESLPMRIRLKEKTFDAEECLKLFFSGKTVDNIWEGNYRSEDGSLLCVNSNSVDFCDGKTANLSAFQIEAPVNYQVALTIDDEYCREIFDIGNEINGFPSRGAIDRALDTAAALGIAELDEPEIYAFSLDSLQKIKESDLSFAFNDKYPLTEDNEVYVLHFRQLFNGVELAGVSTSVKDSAGDTGSYPVDAPAIAAGVSGNDIFYFGAAPMYESEFEVANGEPAKYDLNYALQELASYLDKAYFQKETEINKVKPVYFPVERNALGYVEYALAWSFEGTAKQKSSDYRRDEYKIIVLAETGVIMNFKG
ncbi:MAG: hypothetical protein NC299_16025 [Lachnospiraceae bacterium]|nr:hypothetical protein [Ruminococcus sp.]MCM1276843.1 hypothetical protein [Lachnospiraceae bacterium]